MAKQFTAAEWKTIRDTLDADPDAYGFPTRRPGSLLFGSFNIRKLGDPSKRNEGTWDFLAHVCRQFDLLAVQEVQDDLSGLRELVKRMGREFEMTVSDATGIFPGRSGMAERLAFVYRPAYVERTEIATDVSVDRTAVMATLIEKHDPIDDALDDFEQKMIAYEDKMLAYARGERKSRPGKPKVKMPTFLTFIRSPFLVSFRVAGTDGAPPLQFMAVNAHLYYGHYEEDRRQEFTALLEWLVGRVRMRDTTYYQDFILLGDLNLDFDAPENDMERIVEDMKRLDAESPTDMHVNFPFLDPYPGRPDVFRTNARLKETFDHIGLFFRDGRLPDHTKNAAMGGDLDYGVFDFVGLFSAALLGERIEPPTPDEDLTAKQRAFIQRFEHKVSDHVPVWLRIPQP